ncbi:hypothetical protein NE865_14977 [Phthorimaea operculella]|nr:hypothetical protein NE865_14977 [Phthorimaea operculella]
MTRRTSTLSSSSTLAGVVQEVNPDLELAPTSSVSTKRRRWTPEMNMFILRTYLQLTALDTDTKTYLEPLHLKFIEKYPDIEVSRQRVGDQRRAIVRNKLLPQSTIDQIYSEVREEFNNLERNVYTSQPQQMSIHTSYPRSSSSSRMRWTTEQNETIIRAYYKITELDTNRTTYRQPLHDVFITAFPSLSHVSEQRVSDQLRAILNNKYISDDRLHTIRQEVAEELSINTNSPIIENTNDADVSQDNNEISFLNEIDLPISEELITEQQNPNPKRDPKIDETFNETYQHFTNTDPTTRPFIPRQKSSKKLAAIVDYLNKVTLPENINLETDFNTLQTKIYCAAWTAAKINGAKLSFEPTDRSRPTKTEHKPHWQRRLERRLEDLRTKIARLTHFINGSRSRNLEKQVEGIIEQYKIHTVHEESNTQLTHTLDTLKQKLSVTTGRLRRYNACNLRKQQNIQFKNNERQFYRKIRQETTNTQDNTHSDSTDDTPDPEDLQCFWAGIWEQPVEHNVQAEWIQIETENHNTVPQMTFDHIPIDTFQKVLRVGVIAPRLKLYSPRLILGKYCNILRHVNTALAGWSTVE